jgi:hypothetical protein
MIFMQFYDAWVMGYLDTLSIRGLVLVAGWFSPIGKCSLDFGYCDFMIPEAVLFPSRCF